MSRTPTTPVALRGKIFRGSDQVRAGRLTKAQLRSTAWRRLFPDVYACSSLPPSHARRARALATLAVPGSVLSGRSAAVLWGIDLAGPDDDVECTLRPDCRSGSMRGVRVTRRRLADDDITHHGGVPVTTPRRTALDLAREEPLEEAVACLDRLVRAGLVELADVREDAARLTGPGCRRVRRAASLADGLAESPQETRLRLVLRASRLPPAVAQHVVRRPDGAFVARVDFAWPDRRVAVEYEGIWHGEAQQVARDRRRLNALTAAGWTVVFVTAADLRDPATLVARVAAALAAPRYA
ncbi:type IV toxin-antitoxin system AbiEi family antitoxin [Blastococcus sp. LR1]|uniref:type IV toxin-antitoxin system AbiEi family antitoxin n=1 Tax=Blastococcus sp. LR1 TaxID=2877000 RepID=UPI001CCF95FB|nr:type IV toxin-antitoxin system AbiEi family antitoxin [Blastococcus sp. LR1]MCA0146433.1 endonuclease domain-containing protein [Blastococcus sp. LR1]